MDSMSLNNMSEGMGEWRNIQPVLRSTFRSLSETLSKQSATIASLEAELAQVRKESSSRSSELEEKISANFQNLNLDFDNVTKKLDDRFYEGLQRLENELHSVRSALEEKAEDKRVLQRDEFNRWRQTTERQLSEFNTSIAETLRSQVSDLSSQFARLRDTSESDLRKLSSALRQLQAEAQRLGKRIVLIEEESLPQKVGTQELMRLLESKANVLDVNQALLEVSKELDSKAPYTAVKALGQAIADRQRVTVPVEGRWAWGSGKTRTKDGVSMIPWNSQILNSCPDNFVWHRDKTVIGVKNPGLYQVTFGFFGKRKATVQFMVDDDPVVSSTATSTGAGVVYHAPRPQLGKRIGTVTGQTHTDYVCLPADAKISISYTNGDPATTHGFLALRRL